MDEQKVIKNRKWIVLVAALVALLGVIVAIVWFALTPRTEAEPEKIYNEAKRMISIGQYEKAYYLLQACVDSEKTEETTRSEAKKLLEDFELLCGEHSQYDGDGNLNFKETVIWDETAGTITYIDTNEDGVVCGKTQFTYRNGKEVYWTGWNAEEHRIDIAYEYDADGNRTGVIFYNPDNSIESQTRYQYDAQGHKIGTIHYDAEGNILLKTTCQFDEQGREILLMTYDSDESAMIKEEHIYDEAGNLVKEYYIDQEGKYIYFDEYTYDEAGNLTTMISYDADGNVKERIEHQHDKDGNTIAATAYQGDGSVLYRWEDTYLNGRCVKHINYNEKGEITSGTEREFNKDGKIILQVDYGADGKVERRTGHTYDQDGNEIRYVSYNGAGTILQKSEYTYDRNGNKITLRSYNQFGYVTELAQWSYDKNGNVTYYVRYNGSEKKLDETIWKDYKVIYLPEFGK